MEPTVLIVDDEAAVRETVRRVVRARGGRAVCAASAEEALESFRREPCSLVVTDLFMGRSSGLDLLRQVRSWDPDAVVIVMTSNLSIDTALGALEAGAYDYVVKPFADARLIGVAVDRALERVRLVRHNRDLLEHLDRNAEHLERINSALSDIANRDGLTGLHNRRHLRDALETEVGRARRHGRPFSVIALDVDHFKRYNDVHGRLAGDALLRTLARLLQRRSRTSTIVSRDDGAGFVLLTPETPADGARRYAEALCEVVAEHRFMGGESQPLGRVTASVGVASFPSDAPDGAALLERARQRLDRAKRAGRNRVVADDGSRTSRGALTAV